MASTRLHLRAMWRWDLRLAGDDGDGRPARRESRRADLHDLDGQGLIGDLPGVPRLDLGEARARADEHQRRGRAGQGQVQGQPPAHGVAERDDGFAAIGL